ncbi:MAG TPA: hypothetical protein VEI47_09185 [Gemmatimonadales bacterium]|jgi:uncharacterized protein involved in exopolysaccharide biosynthesis|nr:hypothetical protein [Gemmatimonadales bacterium]
MRGDVATSDATPATGPSLLETAAIVLRWRRYTLGLPVAAAVVAGAVALVLPRQYTVETAFLPQRSQSSLGRLAGLAAQFGVAVPGQNAGESPEFYADLVASREILSRIVTDSFAVSPSHSRMALVDLLNGSGDSAAAREQDAVKRLGRRIAVSTDPKTGVVTVRVTTRWPAVSAGIAASLLAEVNRFDLQVRQTQASAERAFVEDRLKAAKDELRAAEDRSAAFLVTNREFRNAPTLQFQYDRLSREVSAQQQVVTTLQQDYEQARIDEVRNTPRVTPIEQPIVPARPDSRHLLLVVTLAALVGVVIGWPAALILEHLRRARQWQRGDVEVMLGELREAVPARWRELLPK